MADEAEFGYCVHGEPFDPDDPCDMGQEDLPLPREGMRRVVWSYAKELWGEHSDGGES